MNQVANNLKLIRQKAGLTQSQLAKKLYLSQSAYQRIESGKSSSLNLHLENLSAILGVDPTEILFKGVMKKEDQIIKNLYNSIAKMYEELLQEKNNKIKYLESEMTKLIG